MGIAEWREREREEQIKEMGYEMQKRIKGNFRSSIDDNGKVTGWGCMKGSGEVISDGEIIWGVGQSWGGKSWVADETEMMRGGETEGRK